MRSSWQCPFNLYKVFSHDVMTAILEEWNKGTAAMLDFRKVLRLMLTSSLAHPLRVRKITLRSPKHFLLGFSWGRLVANLRPCLRSEIFFWELNSIFMKIIPFVLVCKYGCWSHKWKHSLGAVPLKKRESGGKGFWFFHGVGGEGLVGHRPFRQMKTWKWHWTTLYP